MTGKEFAELLRRHEAELVEAVERRLPVKVGRLGKSHFQENFRLGGFVDDGLRPWSRTHRQSYGRGARAEYGPLMSGRQHLYGAMEYVPRAAEVTISNPVSYADIHNRGGRITVTARMKRYFWARYYECKGGGFGRETKEAEFWRRMALMKTGGVITIPQRQFMGESKQLNDKIAGVIEETLGGVLTDAT